MHPYDRGIGRYDLVKLLGKGPFTEVYLGQNDLVREMHYAVKRPLQRSTDHLQLLQRRVYILSQLEHPSIVRTYTLDNPEPGIGLTFAQQGSLYERISTGDSCDLRFIISCTLQLMDALAYAHSKGFVHGNLKPQNILFDRQGAVLLSDFDVPTLPFFQSQPVLRELPYKAPEQEKQGASPATDQYQLACKDYRHSTCAG